MKGRRERNRKERRGDGEKRGEKREGRGRGRGRGEGGRSRDSEGKETMNSRDANKLTWLGKRERVSRLGWAEVSQSWKWDPGLRKRVP